MNKPMDDRVNMELSEHEKKFIIKYRKASSNFKLAVDRILGVEEPRPQLRIVKDSKQ